ncbi:Glycosyltransferase Gtf1 [Sulfuracidifex tepidarius]|uniref:Glycosyltransferase Gtf1 n=1 Tax=Sulfuracidifex tepidarius TaxID=1294262 RepID=A0A510DSL6_9CREN|nr:glycosyltransferase [Sulfuracidifex tepidarius]BBG23186.1 Glycosyltransferase Gtf1 [Sulfuracidifex tepidarius]
MKITVVTSGLGSNYSGGSVHVSNVIKRLTNYFDVEFIPSINFFVSNRNANTEIENIRKFNIKIPDIYNSLDFSKLKPSFLPYSFSIYKEYSEKVNLDSDFIYDPDYTTPESVFLSNRSGILLGITLHEPLYPLNQSILYTYYTLRPFFFQSIDYFVKRSIGLYLLTRTKEKYIRDARHLNFIAGVSESTLSSVKAQRIRKYILYPGNGVDKELLSYRTKNKEDYVVFWTTLIPPKGILNILYIVNLLKKRGIQVKVKIMGKFLYEKFKKFFLEYIKENSLEIEYLGFLEKRELYKVVSKARLLLYPSLADGFSITILESLALGTPVIAYSLPTVYSVYKDIPAIKFVKEGDVKSMANELENELKSYKLLNAVFDEKTTSFIEFHNWDKVAENVASIIKESLS